MGICGSTNYPQVDINFGEPFGDVELRDKESEYKNVHGQVAKVLEKSVDVYKKIEEYKGCQELARAAMSKPSEETELAAFEGLLEAVESIAAFYNYSHDLGEVFPGLLSSLGEKVALESSVAHLDNSPALTAQLARIFDFALSFDRVRMLRPNLSNDFSYYRRLLPKFNKHPNIKVKDDEASGMALFTAEHIPMTSTLAKAGQKASEKMVNDGRSDEVISIVLATMANSSYAVLANLCKDDPSISTQKNYLSIARTMTGAVVIFDHVDSMGAFHKRTPINIKAIIVLLKKEFQNELSLLNAIRYSTNNFRDAPESVQSLFE